MSTSNSLGFRFLHFGHRLDTSNSGQDGGGSRLNPRNCGRADGSGSDERGLCGDACYSVVFGDSLVLGNHMLLGAHGC